jgi:tetratricopeptide (TPR) repeat protein
MRRALTLVFAVLSMTAVWAAQPAEQEMKPIPAAEAERRVGESRDFVADLLWEHTEVYWHTGRWDEVIKLCRRIIAVEPHFLEAYNGAAWMLWSMDRDEEAIELYRAGIAANPDQYEIHHEFGMYYRYRQKWDEAVEQFRKSVERGAPGYFQHTLPGTLERGGKKREALAEWRALLERLPDDPIAKRHIEDLESQLGED